MLGWTGFPDQEAPDAEPPACVQLAERESTGAHTFTAKSSGADRTRQDGTAQVAEAIATGLAVGWCRMRKTTLLMWVLAIAFIAWFAFELATRAIP